MSDDLSNLPGAVVVKPAGKSEKQKSDWDAVSFATGIARSLGQGVTFGFADEAEAYVRSVLGDETYDEAKKATREELSKFRGANPFLSFGLEIGAAIATPGGFLRLASKVPSLAGLASKALAATTATQRAMIGGGAYGAGTAETLSDVPMGIATGAAFGGAAQKVAPVIGQKAKELMKLKIPLSIGQRFGGAIGAVEEGLSKLPIGAEIFGPTRLKAIQNFATASYNLALQPLGKSVKKGSTPREAAAEAQKIFNKSYDDALEGVEITVTDEFIDDIVNSVAPFMQELNKEGQERLQNIIISEIFDRAPGSKLTGKSIQEVQKRFGELANNYMRSPNNFESALGRALRAVDGEMMDIVGKYYPAKAELLKKTNEAYSLYYPVRRAATSAGVKENVFTPAKLLSAIQGEEKKMAGGLSRLERGEARLQRFAEDAAEVIGAKVPESAPLRTALTLASTTGAAAFDPFLTALALGVGKGAYTPLGQKAISFGIEKGISPAMRSPATAGLLAAETAPMVQSTAGGLLGIQPAQAGPSMPDQSVTYETRPDRLGRPATYAVTDGGARMMRVTP